MVAVDRSNTFVPPTPAVVKPSAPVASVPVTPAVDPPAQLAMADQSEARLHPAASFEPVAHFESVTRGAQAERPVSPSIHEPIKGVLRGDELKDRLSTLRDGAARQLINATYVRETLNDVLKNAGPAMSASLLQQVDAYNRADHTVQEMGELLKVLKDDAGVDALQTYLKDSAVGLSTGSDLDTDGIYGAQSDDVARHRIQNPGATYVPPPAARPAGEDVFIYQEGEVGEDGEQPWKPRPIVVPLQWRWLLNARVEKRLQ